MSFTRLQVADRSAPDFLEVDHYTARVLCKLADENLSFSIQRSDTGELWLVVGGAQSLAEVFHSVAAVDPLWEE